jgi:molybdenum cofactor cytidylyltransferase
VRVAGVVLAAGFSKRLGRPKQTVVLGGEMLVERAVRVAMEAGLSPVIVVVGVGVEFAEGLKARGCVVVVNEEAEEGMASSIRCGIAVAGEVGGVVLMTCDQVRLGVEHLLELCSDVGSVAGSGYGGRVGIPAYFPASKFGGLRELRGDVGAREMLRGVRVVVDEGLLVDVDTVEDLRRLEEERL